MLNPLDFVTPEDIIELGLTKSELLDSYKPSSGGVYHARGGEGKGKTLLIVHKIRELIDIGYFKPHDGVGNLTLKGKYGIGYQTLKGDDLRQYLWDLTHKPYKHKFVIIDEIDSEFPARTHYDIEQTEIALRMWHIQKLDNFIFMTSHMGNSTDLIFHYASHYYLYPDSPNWISNTLDYIMYDNLNDVISEWQANDVIKTMLIYNRQELTENTESEQNKIRPSLRKRTKKEKEINNSDSEFLDLDLESELSITRRTEYF